MTKSPKTRKKTPYNLLPFIPTLIADTVFQEVYTGKEISLKHRDFAKVTEVEARRKQMATSRDTTRHFADLVEKRCREAYEADAHWMLAIARARGERGREDLYQTVRHWLGAFIMDPKQFAKTCEATSAPVVEKPKGPTPLEVGEKAGLTGETLTIFDRFISECFPTNHPNYWKESWASKFAKGVQYARGYCDCASQPVLDRITREVFEFATK